ncbi:hypothetical protein NBCG_01585 [Nocardioidaceae bacterium Broad-1]|nr:hypothetical protein NBCG_01585 [Nocardioidaceae bacterium Broad-1]
MPSGVLRAVVESFLDGLTEREFDGPLLAALAAQGFYDIHFLHGSFEFGKDVIAKRRDPETGDVRQYAIQSKAGDIGMSEWRAVRPQLEECSYNPIAHPGFDAALPRVVVLVTTGRLKGGASADAQQFGARLMRLGLAGFETWDREQLVAWFCTDPALGLAGRPVENRLLTLLSKIRTGEVTERYLEGYSRSWIAMRDRPLLVLLELAVVTQSLRQEGRLDLAALLCLHVLRPTGGWTQAADRETANAGMRLFQAYATELLDDVEPRLKDPRDLIGPIVNLGAAAAYPALCCRLVELFACLGLVASDSFVATRARSAVITMITTQPGSAHPPSDSFAVSLLPVVALLAERNRDLVVRYMRSVALWLLDRHDPDHAGLGLASIDEDELATVTRLLGGKLSHTRLEARRASLLATVVLDILNALGATELYEAVLENVERLRINPTVTVGDEDAVRWRRGGPSIVPAIPLPFGPHGRREFGESGLPDVDALVLALVCRSRHYPAALRATIGGSAVKPSRRSA